MRCVHPHLINSTCLTDTVYPVSLHSLSGLQFHDSCCHKDVCKESLHKCKHLFLKQQVDIFYLVLNTNCAIFWYLLNIQCLCSAYIWTSCRDVSVWVLMPLWCQGSEMATVKLLWQIRHPALVDLPPLALGSPLRGMGYEGVNCISIILQPKCSRLL